MKIGEIWQSNEYKNVRVKITNIYRSMHVINPGSIAKDNVYVTTIYISPWGDGSQHADLAREHFLEAYFKLHEDI